MSILVTRSRVILMSGLEECVNGHSPEYYSRDKIHIKIHIPSILDEYFKVLRAV